MKIGLLDSGVGGLSVLREVHALLPEAALHYVGDSAWCPYGVRSPEQIQGRVFHIADYLLSRGAEILVIACNSATIQAAGALREDYPLPIVGMEPGVKPAAHCTRSGVVGVLATEASLAGEKFHQLLSVHAKGIRVITKPCPRFVELVEAGQLDGPEVEKAIREALEPLVEVGADVIVLGCTHYPFLRPVIERHLPEGTRLIDTSPAVARRVETLLQAKLGEDEWRQRMGGQGDILIETTGSLEQLEAILPRLLPRIPVRTGQAQIN